MDVTITLTAEEAEAMAEVVTGTDDLIKAAPPPVWFDAPWKHDAFQSAREKVLRAWMESRL